MSNQDILNTLAALEEEFYYRQSGGADREGTTFENSELMHTKINEILHIWHTITGLKVD